jgi:DNA-binding response OmpR family regulator
LLRAWSPGDRSLDTHINRLRRKVGRDARGRTPIRTLTGVGYLLLADWDPVT